MKQNFVPGLLAALLYGVVSGSMSFMNKMLLTSYKYHYPDVIMLTQIVVTSILIEVCRMLKLCQVPAWTVERSKEFLFPSLCFALHTTLALAALDDLSIPIYNVLRRMLPLATLCMSVFILKQKPSRNTVLAIAIIMAGTLVAGVGDLRFTYIGYTEAILSVIAQSTYLSYVQKTGVEKGTSTLSVLHLNSINCIPVLLLYTLGRGSLLRSLSFPGFADTSFLTAFVLNILLGCLLNYTLFLCATMNSALTTSVVGVIKGVLTTTIGFFTFGGVPITYLTVGGVTLNALGGVLYIMVRYCEKQRTKKEAELPLTNGDISHCNGDIISQTTLAVDESLQNVSAASHWNDVSLHNNGYSRLTVSDDLERRVITTTTTITPEPPPYVTAYT